jgi:diguanylate cyclase (GGDEF)-like protein
MSFEGKERPVVLATAAGTALVLVAALITAGVDGGLVRLAQLGLVGPLYLAAAAVLWMGRGDKLRARLPLVAILFLHSAVSLVGLAEGLLREALPYGVPSFGDWYSVVHVESMIYFIGSALFLVALLKEQSESVHKSGALIDPLTGLPNRRAFFGQGNRVLERCRRSNAPCSVIAVDLDRFKAVNDTFGHATGDRVLEVFAALVTRQLRPADVVGRLGGEEFAAILPHTHLREAGEIGDRIRTAFSDAALMIDGREIGATLSAGVAVAFGDMRTIAEVLERADSALYRAKLNGRNRVEFDTPCNTIRVVRSAS